METLQSQVEPAGEAFARNDAQQRDLVAQLRQLAA